MFNVQCSMLNVQCSLLNVQCSTFHIPWRFWCNVKQLQLLVQWNSTPLPSSVAQLKPTCILMFCPFKFWALSNISNISWCTLFLVYFHMQKKNPLAFRYFSDCCQSSTRETIYSTMHTKITLEKEAVLVQLRALSLFFATKSTFTFHKCLQLRALSFFTNICNWEHFNFSQNIAAESTFTFHKYLGMQFIQHTQFYGMNYMPIAHLSMIFFCWN